MDDASSSATNFRVELEEWSKTRPRWQRHALWLLATQAEPQETDVDAVVTCLLREIGLADPGDYAAWIPALCVC